MEPVKFPSAISHIWSAFCRLSNARPAAFEGVSPITFEQILAWKQLTKTRIKPWEIEVLIDLDSIYREILNG